MSDCYNQPYPVPGYKNSLNMWQKLCALHPHGSKASLPSKLKPEDIINFAQQLNPLSSNGIQLTNETQEIIKLVNQYQLNVH